MMRLVMSLLTMRLLRLLLLRLLLHQVQGETPMDAAATAAVALEACLRDGRRSMAVWQDGRGTVLVFSWHTLCPLAWPGV